MVLVVLDMVAPVVVDNSAAATPDSSLAFPHSYWYFSVLFRQ